MHLRHAFARLALAASVALAGCGGGGSGSSGPARFGIHIVTSANRDASGASTLQHPALDGNSNALLLITQVWNYGNETGVYNNHPVGVGYDIAAGRWKIYNRDGATLPLQSRFAYRIVTGDSDSFAWIASPANITTYACAITHPAAASNASHILLFTHNWNPAGGPGVWNPNIVGSAADGGGWRLVNLDFTTPFPPSTAYNVTVRPVATDDYSHLTAAAN
ncbi:MAG: hypothetical protein R3F05_19895, partial [Planctomycetota bacterium]